MQSSVCVSMYGEVADADKINTSSMQLYICRAAEPLPCSSKMKGAQYMLVLTGHFTWSSRYVRSGKMTDWTPICMSLYILRSAVAHLTLQQYVNTIFEMSTSSFSYISLLGFLMFSVFRVACMLTACVKDAIKSSTTCWVETIM